MTGSSEEVSSEGSEDLPAETCVLEPSMEVGRILGSVKDGGPQERHDSELGMPVASVLLEKVRSFSDQREEEKLRAFQRVLTLALLTIALGLGLSVASMSLAMAAIEGLPREPLIVFGIFAQIVLSTGTVLASTCPLEMLDIDKFGVRYPKTLLVLGLTLCGWQASEAPTFPHLHVSSAITALAYAISPLWSTWGPWWPLGSTCCVLTFLLGWVAYGAVHSFPRRNPVSRNPAVNEELSDLLAGTHFAWTLAALFVWARQRRLFRSSGGKRGLAPTVALYGAIYANDALRAFANILGGAFGLRYAGTGGEIPVLEIATGVIMLVPVGIVLAFGRATVFSFMANRFDMNTARLSRDGAFVANLLDSLPVEVGGRWWVHRDFEDERFPQFDPRRAWRQGHVKEVLDEEFVVELLPAADANPATATLGTGDGHPQERSLLRVPLRAVGAGKTAEDLLAQAQRGLRCVEFASLTPDLMVRVDARSNLKLQEQWYSLSRPVQPGEAIDFFVSQSWYDDAGAKWQKLQEVASDFHRRHGRYPTIWLDKLCLDQAAITDGLKVLPVYVMACRKMLALCGGSYDSRLWCIWELFTLFAFVSEAAALKRLHFECLGGSHDEGEQILQSLENFHVRNARCYDPNEESRLRRVIAAVGTSRFNARIRNMATAVRKQMPPSSSGGLGRDESWRSRRSAGTTTPSSSEPPPRTPSSSSSAPARKATAPPPSSPS